MISATLAYVTARMDPRHRHVQNLDSAVSFVCRVPAFRCVKGGAADAEGFGGLALFLSAASRALMIACRAPFAAEQSADRVGVRWLSGQVGARHSGDRRGAASQPRPVAGRFAVRSGCRATPASQAITRIGVQGQPVVDAGEDC